MYRVRTGLQRGFRLREKDGSPDGARAFHQRSVTGPDGIPIHTVKFRIVESVALSGPCLLEHCDLFFIEIDIDLSGDRHRANDLGIDRDALDAPSFQVVHLATVGRELRATLLTRRAGQPDFSCDPDRLAWLYLA